MAHRPTRPADNWSPIYFLASLGAGGLAVTFFMYLMFWVPHKSRPVPVFEDILAAWLSGGLGLRAAIAIAVVGIAVFAVMNLRALIWNLGKLRAFTRTEAFDTMLRSNAETTLLAGPLATAMTVNVGFIIGLVFVPGLWTVVEYLFPVALVAFVLIAIWAMRRIGHFLGHVLSDDGVFDVTAHNSFAQLLPAFALSMIAVGLSAPAAMSSVPLTVGVSMVLSVAVGTIAALYAVIAALTAFNSMLHYGVSKEASPTLMVVIPILTVLGIMMMRQTHGLHASFDVHGASSDALMMLTPILAIQLAFAGVGLVVLRHHKYAQSFLNGDERSAGSYALICPGVALSVMTHFWVNKGLVGAGIIVKFGVAYWALTAVALLFQIAMVLLVLKLNRQHFSAQATPAPVPAQ